ncbi:MAG: HAD-IA family hydrolase [candidate division Zixibacteria bacterium]
MSIESKPKLISFDCYGTLIDWETGILAALKPMLESHGVVCDDDTLLETYAGCEAEEEERDYRPYRQVLRSVTCNLGERFSFTPSTNDLLVLEESIKNWPPFSDTVAALRQLKKHFQLAIISNIDDDLFVGSAEQLQVEFDFVTTAAQANAYKPSLKVFEAAAQAIGMDKRDWLHVAQSLYHDILPSNNFGLSSVWVNRRKGQPGSGATPKASATPDLTVADLESLVSSLLSS